MNHAGSAVAGATPNLRDLGGLASESLGVIGRNRLFRSGVPDDADEPPPGMTWPPTVVIDLRSDPERAQHPSLSEPRTVHAPLLTQLAPGAHLDGTLIALYRAVLDGASPLLVDVVRAVADADGSVLIHCSAGKDRTGIAVALILRLLGVDRESVMTDYAATNANIVAIDARLRALPGNEGRDSLPREYFHVVPGALDAVLDVWDEHPGGVSGWFCAAGGSQEVIAALREALLTPVD